MATIVSPAVYGDVTKGDDLESLFPIEEEGMQLQAYVQ